MTKITLFGIFNNSIFFEVWHDQLGRRIHIQHNKILLVTFQREFGVELCNALQNLFFSFFFNLFYYTC